MQKRLSRLRCRLGRQIRVGHEIMYTVAIWQIRLNDQKQQRYHYCSNFLYIADLVVDVWNVENVDACIILFQKKN